MQKKSPEVSFIIATHNRKKVILRTLEGISACGLPVHDYEVILVDNASTDDTQEQVQNCCDRLIPLPNNLGSCAKTLGLKEARGRFIVFLDDDSYPQPGSISRMIEHFQEDTHLGAAGFSVHLPDGRMEGGALPDVFLGCGVGFRREALLAVGGLDLSFFMQAEEYDLTFQMVAAGWRVRMFHDLHVDHLKTASARQNDRTMYFDTRNNLRVIARYLPSEKYEIYRADAIQRYHWLAENARLENAFARGGWSGLWYGFWERSHYKKTRLSAEHFEYFFSWDRLLACVKTLAKSGLKRVLFADLGKNIFAYHRAARLAGIEVVAIADDRFAAPHRLYRSIAVVPWIVADTLNHEAIIVSNTSAVHGTVTYQRIRCRSNLPVHHWFLPEKSPEVDAECPSSTPEVSTTTIKDQSLVDWPTLQTVQDRITHTMRMN